MATTFIGRASSMEKFPSLYGVWPLVLLPLVVWPLAIGCAVAAGMLVEVEGGLETWSIDQGPALFEGHTAYS